MHTDRQIAVWGGWIAGPAFGVAMMAAPEYLHLKPTLAAAFFWGGILAFVVTVFVVAALQRRERERGSKPMWPIIAMAVGVTIFGIGAAGYFWPQHDAPNSETTTDQPALRLIVPSGTSEMEWGPSRGEIIIKSLSPFVLKNDRPSIVASKVQVNWRADASIEAIKDMVLNDAKFAWVYPKFLANRVVLNPRPNNGNLSESEYPWTAADRYVVDTLVTEEGIPPPAVLAPALFYFLATMPKELGKTTNPFPISVSIGWQHPLDGQEQKFQVNVTATNTNPDPDPRFFRARLNFEVKKLN